MIHPTVENAVQTFGHTNFEQTWGNGASVNVGGKS